MVFMFTDPQNEVSNCFDSLKKNSASVGRRKAAMNVETRQIIVKRRKNATNIKDGVLNEFYKFQVHIHGQYSTWK